MPTLKNPHWILLLAMVAAVVVYMNGLNGPFLFDDHIHITKNQWVKIDSLSGPDLAQAWNSSFSPFPTNRPLAQLSFGINHALAGLSPWAFKATNLAIHLLTGLLVFGWSRLAYRAVAGEAADPQRGALLAAATAAVWLLHPLHVSTVLYTVQRMAQLSSLGLLAALSCYFWGRIRIAEGQPGAVWILAAAPMAMLGLSRQRERRVAAAAAAGERDYSAAKPADNGTPGFHAGCLGSIYRHTATRRPSLLRYTPRLCELRRTPVHAGRTCPDPAPRPVALPAAGCTCRISPLMACSTTTSGCRPAFSNPPSTLLAIIVAARPDAGRALVAYAGHRSFPSRCCFFWPVMRSSPQSSHWRWCSSTATTFRSVGPLLLSCLPGHRPVHKPRCRAGWPWCSAFCC